MANIAVSVIDANNISLVLSARPTVAVTIDHGVTGATGNGIASIGQTTISSQYYLVMNYTDLTSQNVGPFALTGTVAAGATTQVQYNSGGALAGVSTFTFASATSTLTVTRIGAFIMAGTINASNNIINNVRIGVTTPNTGNFTTVAATAITASGQIWSTATGFKFPDNSVQTSSAIATVVIVSTTTQTAAKNNHYVLTNVAATTVTLPTTAVAGDSLSVTSGNGLATNVVAYSGTTKIMGLLQNLTLDTTTYVTVKFTYLNSTIGWAIS